jgi:uncharacterized protein YjiK
MPIFIKIFRLMLLIAITAFCCNNIEKIGVASPKGYDFSKGEKVVLPASLKEISGIAFYPGNDSLLMAVNDEEAKLFTIDFYSKILLGKPIGFGKKGDYEDITFFNGGWMVLESNGTLHWVLPERGKKETVTFKVLPEGEYEGLASVSDTLYVLCKDCKDDQNLEASVHKLVFVGDSLAVVVREVLKGKKKDGGIAQKLLPSAFALHPVTKNWYILSHKNAWLMVTDRNFKILEKIPLKRSLLMQPEGIAFNKKGDMFISSEGKSGPGYVIKFDMMD